MKIRNPIRINKFRSIAFDEPYKNAKNKPIFEEEILNHKIVNEVFEVLNSDLIKIKRLPTLIEIEEIYLLSEKLKNKRLRTHITWFFETYFNNEILKINSCPNFYKYLSNLRKNREKNKKCRDEIDKAYKKFLKSQ